MAEKQDIRQLDLAGLQEAVTRLGEKPFRAKQLREWLWNKSATDFEHMTSLSKGFRDLLAAAFVIRPVQVDTRQKSNDGTVKLAFRLHDGHLVEGVLIPTSSRMTACISSQVGCSLDCKFCATGYMKRLRNLDASEIYDQVVLLDRIAQEEYGQGLTNIVYMGMGEPLLNYANVLRSAELITSDWGLGMAARRLTVSTAGIAKMIKKLGDDQVRFNLALSLHAADDEKRSRIMSINDSNTLDVLADALQHYYHATKNEVTFEYIVFYNFNDSLEDAEKLWRFTKRVPSKVNIIEYNPISEAKFTNTDPETLDRFAGFLEDRGVNVRVRRSRGKDIDAACGQLANKDK